MELRQCNFEKEAEMQQLVDLQTEVYRDRGIHFSSELFKAWYVDNPDGGVISFNAFDGNKMVAHQSFVPERMVVDGRIVRCLRSMAVVTHAACARWLLLLMLLIGAVDCLLHSPIWHWKKQKDRGLSLLMQFRMLIALPSF